MSTTSSRQWAGGVAVVPSLAIAVLSKFTCSLCLAAYAGVLSSLGLGVLTTERGLTVFTATFLALSLLSIGWSAWRHRHVGPLGLALLGSAVVLGWRVWPTTPAVLYAGAALVVAASGWNVWAARRPRSALVRLGRTRPAEPDAS